MYPNEGEDDLSLNLAGCLAQTITICLIVLAIGGTLKVLQLLGI